MIENLENTSDFLFYTGADGSISIEVIVGDDTVWLSQKKIAELFDKGRSTITEHIQNIFREGELNESAVCRNYRHTADDGKEYDTTLYNLDVIISVGYRVSSYNATQFRIWATKILKEYMVKGFALDDERLKQGKTVFGKDHFKELVERIQEIRASERRFYQQITDLYMLSEDYDAKSPLTKTFFATVQNKLKYAITRFTVAELIKNRANAKAPNMGLQTWSKPTGKIILKDVKTAKNYLLEAELDEMKSLVISYLDFAELQAKRQKIMKMADWIAKLDSFLKFMEYGVLTNSGSVTHSSAERHAEREYGKFRIIQDREFKSDFDKIASKILVSHKLPKEGEVQDERKIPPLSDFNSNLKTALNYNPKKYKRDDKEKDESAN